MTIYICGYCEEFIDDEKQLAYCQGCNDYKGLIKVAETDLE
jgi:DNA-directed RNA polymerase subunit RPC12/RpoP